MSATVRGHLLRCGVWCSCDHNLSRFGCAMCRRAIHIISIDVKNILFVLCTTGRVQATTPRTYQSYRTNLTTMKSAEEALERAYGI